MSPQVIAHRGNSSVAPENTLAAIAAAISCGAGSVEIDVQLTRDRVPVVIHDDHLDRTTSGSGPVAETDAATLRELDAGSWFSPAFAQQRVPRLDEVLALLASSSDVELLLEVKGAWGSDDVRLVTDAIAASGLGDRVLLQSFAVATVAALADAAPDLRRGLLVVESGDHVLELCRDLGVVSCNPHGPTLVERPELIEQAHAAGMAVMVWTLNDPAQWEAATDLGVDGIITDRPDRLLGWQTAIRRVPA
ncbi:glycerophosphodiester phosphodiesterase [Georgenia sp. MJ170]|uniref:glycerophosphodiester phosphodiesterase n=1 Tax=Georgenia sunbinii TaxID=3117728 RepID=UPI002F26BC53